MIATEKLSSDILDVNNTLKNVVQHSKAVAQHFTIRTRFLFFTTEYAIKAQSIIKIMVIYSAGMNTRDG